jgi:hypothetical protein
MAADLGGVRAVGQPRAVVDTATSTWDPGLGVEQGQRPPRTRHRHRSPQLDLCASRCLDRPRSWMPRTPLTQPSSGHVTDSARGPSIWAALADRRPSVDESGWRRRDYRICPDERSLCRRQLKTEQGDFRHYAVLGVGGNVMAGASMRRSATEDGARYDDAGIEGRHARRADSRRAHGRRDEDLRAGQDRAARPGSI